jgi:hypothetical protein
MLEKLLQHNNLGNQAQISYIIGLLSKGNYSICDLKKACTSKEYTFSNSFDGVICLLEWLGIIKITELVELNDDIFLKITAHKICHLVFIKLANERKLHCFINNNNLDFRDLIYVKNNLIKFSFSSIRNLLINLCFFQNDDLMKNQFIINKEFSKWFISVVVPLIEKSQIENKSLQDLKDRQKRQEELGIQAEIFVLSYEKLARIKNPRHSNIKIISEIDFSAGYDIQSYKNDKSVIIDKFIEVKSYSGSPYFYWSKNEIKIAKQERNNYFLYLINRDEINQEGYRPLIIQNPYKNILGDDKWQKDCQNWKFKITL